MYVGQPLAPIRELQSDEDLTRIEVGVRTKYVRANLPHEFSEIGSVPWWI